MSTLAEQRIAIVAKHMASEITHDFDTTMSSSTIRVTSFLAQAKCSTAPRRC